MKNIVVPTDFSTVSLNAVEYAAKLAKHLGARLHLLHVYHVPLVATDVPVVPNLESIEKESFDRLEKLGIEIQDKHGVVSMIKAEMGFTVDEINEYCDKSKCDLVVLGMRGMSKVAELIVGSTTASYIERGNCPVLVIPADASFKEPKHITFASDLQGLEVHSLDMLKTVGLHFKSRINIVNVLKGELLPDYNKSVAGIDLEHYFQSLSHLFFFPEGRDVIEGIDHFMEKHPSDWLAFVHRKHGMFDRLFGKSFSKKMAYHTHIPLLVLPEKEWKINKDEF
ncbi:MAG: universal stress protein [Flavobacteriales bacterium]